MRMRSQSLEQSRQTHFPSDTIHQIMKGHTGGFHGQLRRIITPGISKRQNDISCMPQYPSRTECEHPENTYPQFHVEGPSIGYVHPITVEEVIERLCEFPRHIRNQLDAQLDHVSLLAGTRKQFLKPSYGMQWGSTVYLFPTESTGIERYESEVSSAYRKNAKLYGAQWSWNEEENGWICYWSPEAIRLFYLQNVLVHEIGHVLDTRNSSERDRERFANDFARKYGRPPSHCPQRKPRGGEHKHRRHHRKYASGMV